VTWVASRVEWIDALSLLAIHTPWDLYRHQTVAGKPRRTCNAVCASSPERAVASFPQIEGLVAGLADGVKPRPGRPWPRERTDRYAAGARSTATPAPGSCIAPAP
jgi:hypothetical protein